MSRKRVLLAILLGVLCLSVVYAYLATPRQQKAPPRLTSAEPRRVAVTSDRPSEVKVRLDQLETEEEPFPGAERDIFRFKAKPAPPPPEPKPTPPPSPVVSLQPSQAAPVTPLETARKALSEFSFLGFLEKGNVRTVFLTSGGELFIVKRNDRFGKDQEFLVTGLSDQTLTVQRRGEQTPMTIPLVENERLQPAVSKPARRESTSLAVPGPRSGPAPRFREALQQAQENVSPFQVQPGDEGEQPPPQTEEVEPPDSLQPKDIFN